MVTDLGYPRVEHIDSEVGKGAVLLDSSREFRVSTSDLNNFAREETVLAALRF
jgi:hypothetical protein